MTRLRVKQVCPKSRVFRDDGDDLRGAIERGWSDQDLLEVDFENETIASVSFLDQGIASLFVDYPAEVIRRRLKVVNLTEPDRRELNRLVALRRRQGTAA